MIVIFLMFIKSVRGRHCHYLPLAPKTYLRQWLKEVNILVYDKLH